MKIFIPAEKDPNPYLSEISRYSSNEFIYEDYRNFRPEYPIINIHWPEAIFSWRTPTDTDLAYLEKEIQYWKKFSKLIYFFHDERSHFSSTKNHEKLFNLIENSADAFVHLGEMSKTKMEVKYPDALHCVIPHPTYVNSFQQVNKMEARQKLNIDPEALVIFAPGRIRKLEERKMLINAFQSISQKNKVLISNNMLPFLFKKDFRGRTALKKIFDVNKFFDKKLHQKYSPPKYLFNYGFLDSKELSYMISAADLIFIPRIDVLNSGNVFLGLTYRKVIIGPAIGNIKEILSAFNLPIFDPQSKKSVKNAMHTGIKLYRNKIEIINEQDLLKFHPQQIASKLDEWFEKLRN